MKQIIALLIIILAVGCTVPPGPEPTTIPTPGASPLDLGTYESGVSFDPESDIKTMTFASDSDLEDFMNKYQSGGYYGYNQFSRGMEMNDAIMAESAPMMDGEMTKSSGLDFSETNNQVATVDEADLIKTDGDYIYTISNNVVYIIKAYPGEDAEVVSTIKFEDDNPQNLFINGDKLAVFGNLYNLDVFEEIDFRPSSGMTFFNVYDVSDRDEPELIKEYMFEGNYFNARMYKDNIYFVTRSGFNTVPRPMPPIHFVDSEKMSMPIGDIYYYNIPYNYPQFVNIHSIDIEDVDLVDSASVVVEGSQNLYMSEDNMYITYSEYINEWQIQQDVIMELMMEKLTSADKKVIEKIKKTDNEVLSQAEKEQKIMNIIESYVYMLSSDDQDELEVKAEKLLKEKLEAYEYFEFTVINKIGLDGTIDVKHNGKVPGSIINQFSMDEDDDVFRIATTINGRWSSFEGQRTESTNNVYTLDSKLEMLGSLEGLAETERIYSTRFMGDKLYMVTFRQVDPFFVIDLSDAKNPKELGELKIPGFSRYLHPYDETTIIGIGQDATDRGRTTGLKISLFDVSDFENPKEIAQYVGDDKYAQSTAMYEHKAFLFSKEKELMVIPVYNPDYRWDESGDSYNGAFVFRIKKDDIELRGLIDHSMNAEYSWSPAVERSLYIEDLLYTKSTNLLRINDLEDLHSVKNVTLQAKNSKIPVY